MRVCASSFLLSAAFLAVGSSARAEGPFTKGPYLQELGPTAVTLRVEVDPPQAVSAHIVGGAPEGADAGALDVQAKDARALHSLRVTGLTPGTRYSYVVRAGAASQRGTFSTAPKDDAHARFSFVVYGDNRTDPVAHAAVTRALTQTPSDFLLNTGDLVEDGRDAEQWRQFFDVEQPLLKDRCMFACVGNHELLEQAGESYLRYFGPSDTTQFYRSFRWGNARFFLLNGQDTFEDGPEREWLVRELDKAKSEEGLAWRIVAVHFGYRSAGPHGDNPRLLAGGVDKLFKQRGIDIVISGHDHLYERGLYEGMRYIVSGGGGAPLYRVRSPLPSTRKVEPAYHFVSFEVSDDAVKVVAKRIDGSVLDTCGFGHSGGWDCDTPQVGAAPPTTVPASAPAPPSRCGCGTGPSGLQSRPSELAGSLGGLVAGVMLALRRRFRYSRR